MELTLESAFSTGGLIGHLAYLLLVVSMLMRSMVRLRILVIASSITGITYAAIWLHDPVSVFWETLLISVNIGQLIVIWLQNRSARFSEEERTFMGHRLNGLPPGEARALLDLGTWRNLPDGVPLTQQGVRPDHLSYVASGTVGIYVDGTRVAECGAGRYVGEMSLIDRGPASASARVEGGARVWQIPVSAIDGLRDDHPARSAVLDSGIVRDLRAKIISANTAAAR